MLAIPNRGREVKETQKREKRELIKVHIKKCSNNIVAL